jgi:hypothetical protein
LHIIPYFNGDFLNGKKKSILLFLLFGGVPACFCSCVSGGKAGEDKPVPYVWLADSSKYILLPTKDIEHPLDMPQLVSASYGGRDYLLNTWVKADETGINMTLINELGANMGELSYRDEAVSFSSSVFPPSLRPEYIVADFQLCFYQTPALRRALEGCGLSLEDTGDSRRILQGKTAIIKIEKTRNAVRFDNYLRGYTYTLEGDFQ